MKQILILLVIPITITLLTSCQPSQNKQIQIYKQRLNTAVSSNNTNLALCTIDSIHNLFPKEVEFRRFADTTLWKIEYNIIIDSLPKIAKQITWSDSVANSLLHKFKFIKNDKYETIGHFEHKLLYTERNVNRCYIKPTIDEHGVAKIISHYKGKPLQHHGISISIDNNSISTGQLNNSDIHTFNDLDNYHEVLAVPTQKSTEIIRYIASNNTKKIKITLEGDTYNYYLTNTEKEAISESWMLHKALSTIYWGNDVELRLQQKIEILKKRLFIRQ